MTKTLYCEKERKSNLEIPTYTKVTATKVAEIETGKRKPGFVMIRRISKALNLEESFIRSLLWNTQIN